MAHGEGQARLVRERLELPFPETQPHPVAAPAVRRDENLARAEIQASPFRPPPAANRGDGKRAGVMVRPHIDEPGVAPHVVEAVRIGAGNSGVRKVVAVHGDGLFRGPPLLAAIVVGAHQFLLLRVDRNDRDPSPQRLRDRGVDMAELRVPVGMVIAFLRLPIALQPVVLVVQEGGQCHMADRMVVRGQLRRQGPRALTDPAQRRLGVPPRIGIDQPVHGREQARIARRDRPAACARTTDPTDPGRRAIGNLGDAPRNGVPRQAAGSVHEGHATIPQTQRFVGRHQASRVLIEQSPDRGELLPQDGVGAHAYRSYGFSFAVAIFIY